ncbi:serine/threonine-protein kinase [Profundibacter sp.]
MTNSTQGLKPGDIIQDTYEIIRLLGEGGMGATFEGRNLATGHSVAIKVMSAEFSRNEKAVQLFRRESSLMRTVHSDAVARYETTLQDKTGRLFLVMEFVQGKSLADYAAKGARLGDDDLAKLGLRLATGLAAIHKLNIVHRDIAPDNIQVPDDDILGAKLIDFGLASNTIGTEKSIIGDSIAGKFSYMAPEQMGMFGGKATAATDIYALGLVLLRISGRKVPGEGMGLAALEARRTDISLKGLGFAPPLAKLLTAMLRADPAKRPTDLVALFRKVVEAIGKSNRPASSIGKTAVEATGIEADETSRSLLPIAVAALVLVVAGAGAVWTFVDFSGDTSGQSSAAQQVVAADNPFQEVDDLLGKGGSDNLNAAFGALMALSQAEDASDASKIEATLRVARMYDPQTHSTETSPFPKPNASAAMRMYQRAADLGSNAGATAVERLKE